MCCTTRPFKEQLLVFLSHLEVVGGKLQHVPQSIADDLRLPLKNHVLVVQRFYDLRLDLQENTRTRGQPPAGKQTGNQWSCIINGGIGDGMEATAWTMNCYCPFTPVPGSGTGTETNVGEEETSRQRGGERVHV